MSRKRDKRRRNKHQEVFHLEENVVTQKPRTARRKRVQIYPKNLNQEIYLEKLNDIDKMVIFAIGPAGTGKTLLAVQWAIDQFKEKRFSRIVVTRPAVSVDEEHGFLPGDLNEKMAPWTRPIFDVFADNFSSQELENLIREGYIETSPLAYMRGRTFKNAVVVADEMQNATSNQMKMLLTRLGLGSSMIVTGDLSQADHPSNNGLLEFLKLFKDFEDNRYVDLCHFTSDDIERHEAVKEILAIYGDL